MRLGAEIKARVPPRTTWSHHGPPPRPRLPPRMMQLKSDCETPARALREPARYSLADPSQADRSCQHSRTAFINEIKRGSWIMPSDREAAAGQLSARKTADMAHRPARLPAVASRSRRQQNGQRLVVGDLGPRFQLGRRAAPDGMRDLDEGIVGEAHDPRDIFRGYLKRLGTQHRRPPTQLLECNSVVQTAR